MIAFTLRCNRNALLHTALTFVIGLLQARTSIELFKHLSIFLISSVLSFIIFCITQFISFEINIPKTERRYLMHVKTQTDRDEQLYNTTDTKRESFLKNAPF